jgi:hypothetical protein
MQIEGSPDQSFIRFTDQNGNLLVALNKDGSVSTTGVTLPTGNSVITSTTLAPGVTLTSVPNGIFILQAGNFGTGAQLTFNGFGAQLTDGASDGNTLALGLLAQENEDAQTGALIQTSPGLDFVIGNGTNTWRFEASSGSLVGVDAGITATQLPVFTVAELPGSGTNGQVAWASNGRAVGEGPGSGTGVPVYLKNNLWHVYSTDAQVQS